MVYKTFQNGLNETEVGLVFAAMALIFVLPTVPTGWLADRFVSRSIYQSQSIKYYCLMQGTTILILSGLILTGIALILIGIIPFIPTLSVN